MRRALLAAALALSSLTTPAAAAVVTTTTDTMTCNAFECVSFASNISALQPFDSTLGVLTNIVLKIDVTTSTAYGIGFIDGGFNIQSASGQFDYSSIFDAVINGITYSLPVTGSDAFEYTGYPNYAPLWFNSRYFQSTGSATFHIDPSLFSTFVDTSNFCTTFKLPGSGICVSGGLRSEPTFENILTSSNNLVLNYSVPAPSIMSTAQYSLTYVFRPVPEPSTWAMMLLGVGGIGIIMRHRRKVEMTRQKLQRR